MPHTIKDEILICVGDDWLNWRPIIILLIFNLSKSIDSVFTKI